MRLINKVNSISPHANASVFVESVHVPGNPNGAYEIVYFFWDNLQNYLLNHIQNTGARIIIVTSDLISLLRLPKSELNGEDAQH